jgi:hypothetical protein
MRLKDKVAIVTGAAGFGSFLFCRCAAQRTAYRVLPHGSAGLTG